MASDISVNLFKQIILKPVEEGSAQRLTLWVLVSSVWCSAYSGRCRYIFTELELHAADNFFYCLVRCSSTTRELMWMNCLIVLLFSWIKWTYASHLSRFVSIFMSVVSFMKVVRLHPSILFYLSGLWYRAIMNRQQLPKKPVAVFNRSMFVPFITAGIVCLFPTNSWHLLVNPLDYTHFSLILMHVPEGERRVTCKKKQLKIWRDFMNCFLPCLFHWPISIYLRDLLLLLQDHV